MNEYTVNEYFKQPLSLFPKSLEDCKIENVENLHIKQENLINSRMTCNSEILDTDGIILVLVVG